MHELTAEAGAGIAVPVISAEAVGGAGIGAAGVRHIAARLDVHLPSHRQAEGPANTQTLYGNNYCYLF